MLKKLVGIAILFAFNSIFAEDPGGDTLYTRIIDTGSGLCTVTRMPDDHYMVYDTGHWNGVAECMAGIKRIIPFNAKIDLLVLSHSDGDHVSATDDILETYQIKTVIRTGDWRFDIKNWRQVFWNIKRKRESGDISKDINLYHLPDRRIKPGTSYDFGETKVVFVAGFNEVIPEWGIGFSDFSKQNNAISIVSRVIYKDKSILFTGDIVGRTDDGIKDCWATEKYIVDNSDNVPINSDVLIAPHHGANNASSNCFIEKVNPEFVIFSAGHSHKHPRAAVAKRYLDHGVNIENIFRTDLGDNEGGKEWSFGNTDQPDKKGDDDIEIIIDAAGKIVVRYAQ